MDALGRRKSKGSWGACKYLAERRSISIRIGSLTVVEISKSAPAPLRMFNMQVSRRSGQRTLMSRTRWSGIGYQHLPDEGYVCTTGRIPSEFRERPIPLHIRRAAGDMPVEHCLSDVFSLSCLTWTRPEGATRLPISIKLCDRILFDEAAEYDRRRNRIWKPTTIFRRVQHE